MNKTRRYRESVQLKPNYIDLFSGCGGLSLGLCNAGWQGIFAVEKSPQAFKTFKYNLIDKKSHFDWPDWLPQKSYDIIDLLNEYSGELLKLRNKVTLIAGGPPCQGFSIAGQRNESDSRNRLINSYVRFVSIVKPAFILFENVKGFTMKFKSNNLKGKKYSEIVSESFKEEGYNVYGELVNFGDYGVPQKRTRFILVGIRRDIAESNKLDVSRFFTILKANRFSFLEKKGLTSSPTVKEALSDLLKGNNMVETPDRKHFESGLYGYRKSLYQRYIRKNVKGTIPDSHSYAKHTDRIISRLEYIRSISTECKNLDKNIKEELGITKQVLIPLQANEQAPTITSNPDDLIHYSEPRILTVREYARLQSFPDWYEFKGTYTTGGKFRKVEVPRYTQVGNAIPPLFAELAGITIKEVIVNGKDIRI